jgi:hypothetical protein
VRQNGPTWVGNDEFGFEIPSVGSNGPPLISSLGHRIDKIYSIFQRKSKSKTNADAFDIHV